MSSLELREAEQSLASQQAALSLLRQQRVETRHALAILFNAAPGSATLGAVLPTEPQQLSADDMPAVAAGLPAELLGRRPDVRAAELRLRESLVSADATRASYYPSLTLTGSLGGASSSLANVLANPGGMLGAGLLLPFLNQTAMKLNAELSKVRYQEAAVNFRQSLYQALSEVENALSARTQYAQQLAAARDVERLYELRYRAGAATLKLWLDAQEKRRSAELALAENQYNRLNNQVTLYKALGGNAAADAEARR